ncbi:MAG TPA: YybS family protein [Geobacteraceae bacterium]|nr:YybS family protein [Geobacteraceae bacterium]
MKFPDKGTLLDLVKGSVATLTLFLAYIMLPLVGMLPGLFAPFPAIYYTLKRDRPIGTAIVAVSALVLALVADASATLLYLLQCGVISLTLPVFLLRGKKGARSIAYTVAINLGVIVLLAGIYGASQGVNPHVQVLKEIQSSIAQVAPLYEKAGIKGEDLKSLQQNMEEAGRLIGRIYPALVVVSLAFIAGLNLLLLMKTAARLLEPSAIGDFVQFKNPEQLVWVLIVAGFAVLVPNPLATTAALNVLVVVIALYSVQGLAIIAHFFNRFAVPRFMRVVFYVVLALQPYLAIAVAALGIFDIWGDFRTPRPPKQQENL